jgi:hypothetical protein
MQDRTEGDLTGPQLKVVQAVQRHALDHYDEGGWDYVVEATTAAELWEEIAQELGWAGIDPGTEPAVLNETAIRLIGKRYGLRDEVRRDVQNA